MKKFNILFSNRLHIQNSLIGQYDKTAHIKSKPHVMYNAH